VILRLEASPEAIVAAEEQFIQALEWARRQEALSWELRVASSLAALWHERSKTVEAEQLLSSVYNKFNEGFETSDLKAARALIHVLRTSLARS
jgi:predicted ATPase